MSILSLSLSLSLSPGTFRALWLADAVESGYRALWLVHCALKIRPFGGSPENDIQKNTLPPPEIPKKIHVPPPKIPKTHWNFWQGHSVSEFLAGAHVFFSGISGGGRVFFWMAFSGLPPKTPPFWKYIELMAGINNCILGPSKVCAPQITHMEQSCPLCQIWAAFYSVCGIFSLIFNFFSSIFAAFICSVRSSKKLL